MRVQLQIKLDVSTRNLRGAVKGVHLNLLTADDKEIVNFSSLAIKRYFLQSLLLGRKGSRSSVTAAVPHGDCHSAIPCGLLATKKIMRTFHHPSLGGCLIPVWFFKNENFL